MNQKIKARIEVVARQMGERLRQARRKQNITLGELSQETALSVSFLSRLERGETSTSIANLIMIATRLGISLHEFFEEAPDSGKGYILSRAQEREGKTALIAHGYSYRLSTGDIPDQQMSAFELSFPPGSKEQPALLTHDGEEVLYLIEGSIEFHIERGRLRAFQLQQTAYGKKYRERHRQTSDGRNAGEFTR
jgi:transcriptional regulator with XRE-family HTH domain